MKFDEIGYNFAVHEGLGFVEVDTDGRILAWGNIKHIMEDHKEHDTVVYTIEQYLKETQHD